MRHPGGSATTVCAVTDRAMADTPPRERPPRCRPGIPIPRSTTGPAPDIPWTTPRGTQYLPGTGQVLGADKLTGVGGRPASRFHRRMDSWNRPEQWPGLSAEDGDKHVALP